MAHDKPPAAPELPIEEPQTNPVDELPKKSAGLSKLAQVKIWLATPEGKKKAGIALGIVIVTAGIFATPLRYPIVGAVYKNHTQITVLDAVTHQPLPNAEVQLGGQTGTTDNQGVAKLTNLNLGKTTLTVTKKAYKTHQKSVVVPIFPAKYDSVNLESAGTALAFEVTNKISGQTIDGVEIAVAETKAVSEEGKGRLVLLPEMGETVTATVSKEGFLKTTVSLANKATTEAFKVQLVPSGKTYFLSNRSGRIDLYESNLDGSELQVILAGTGTENADTGVLPSTEHPNLLAVVSAREGKRDNQGNLRSFLYLLDTSNRKLLKIDEDIYFGNYRAWVGEYLVFEKNNYGDCSKNAIKSFNLANLKTTTIVSGGISKCPQANAAYYETIIYSISSYNSDQSQRGLFAIRADGSKGKKIINYPTNNIRSEVKNTLLAVYYDYNLPKPQIWHSIDLTKLTATKIDSAPNNQLARTYIESPGEKYSMFIEERDGKTDIYLTDENGSNERKLTSLGSVNQFVQWYGDDYIVFSSTKSDENALYVVAVKGGAAHKIADFYRGNSRTYGGGYNPNY